MEESIFNRKKLKELRKTLRNNGTSAEAVCWNFLKSRRLQGRKFSRQKSIENYIVDFYCCEEKLVIELDGAHHYNVGGQINDEHRGLRLKSLGLKVLRLENELILKAALTTPNLPNGEIVLSLKSRRIITSNAVPLLDDDL